MKVVNKKLFFLYAHPCGDVLVRRGSMSREVLERIRSNLKEGGEVKESPELFKVAYKLQCMLAEEMGKKEIDEEVIREYYWRKHDEHVMEESRVMKDVIPVLCRVFPAKVVKLEGEEGVVETPVGRRKVNIEFIPNVCVGDFLTVHYSYACERIDEDEFKKLWREKNE
ncbi:MAG: HypC/HybG/HupF family hydrogenase formation chaperone [Candidatus Micrarchaeia archaeon]